MMNIECSDWDLEPHHLSLDEIRNPMHVIDDFFQADWLDGHQKRLKEWRNVVLEARHFKDPNGCPASLLFTYKLNIKLIEAVYLLVQRKDHFQSIWWNKVEDMRQLDYEKATWQQYPFYLEQEELLDPALVIQNFFSRYSLPEYGQHLYEWLEGGLSIYGVEEYIYAIDLIGIYENLQKLYEACWVLLRRQKEPDIYSRKTGNASIPIDLKSTLNLLVSSVKPEKIYLINQGANTGLEGNLHFSLVMIIPEKNHMTFKEMEPIVALSVSQYPFVHVSLLKSHSVREYLNRGHIFYSFICRPENVIYDDGQVQTTAVSPELLKPVVDEAESMFTVLISKALQFESFAQKHRDEEDRGLTVFLLHQATELAFRAVVMSLSGVDPRNHSLRYLKQHNLNHLPLINDIFPEQTSEDASLFKLLEESYGQGRYSHRFTVEKEHLEILFKRVEQLHETVSALFAEQIAKFRSLIVQDSELTQEPPGGLLLRQPLFD